MNPSNRATSGALIEIVHRGVTVTLEVPDGPYRLVVEPDRVGIVIEGEDFTQFYGLFDASRDRA